MFDITVDKLVTVEQQQSQEQKQDKDDKDDKDGKDEICEGGEDVFSLKDLLKLACDELKKGQVTQVVHRLITVQNALGGECDYYDGCETAEEDPLYHLNEINDLSSQGALLRYDMFYGRIAMHNKLERLTCNPFYSKDNWNPDAIVYLLQHCTSLKYLFLGGCIGHPVRLCDQDLKKIAVGFATNTSVTHLFLWDSWITHDSVVFLLEQINLNPGSRVEKINVAKYPTFSNTARDLIAVANKTNILIQYEL